MALNFKLSAFWITFTVFMCCSWIVSGQSNDFKQLTKQEQRILKKSHEAFLQANGGGKLKSGTGLTLPSLQTFYCSEDGYDDIVPDVEMPVGAGDIIWEITTNVAGEGEVAHPAWADKITVDGKIVLRFYPTRVEPRYYNNVVIVFNYTFRSNLGVNMGSGGDITYVHKTPSVFDFGSNTAICDGTKAALTLQSSESGVNYILQRNGVDIPTQLIAGSDGIAITFNVSLAGTYRVRAYTDKCEKMMNGEAVVTVNSAPVLTVSPNLAICAGQSASLSVSSNQDPDVDYLWSTGATTADINVTPAATTSYTVTGTNRVTGCSSVGSVTVTVNALPVVTIGNPSPVCAGDALVLTANVSGGAAPYQYTWTRPDNSTVNGATLDLSPADVASNGLYRLVVTDNNSCGSVEVSTTVTVNPLPNISMTALPNGAVCEGTPIEFTANGGTNYTFYLNGVEVQANSADHTYILASPVNGDVVRVVGGDVNSCLAEDSYSVSVNPLPAVGLVVTPSDEVCLGTNITFMALGGSTYRFYVNDVPQGDWSATNNFQSSTLNTGDRVYARVRSALGCEAQTVTSTVTIHEAVATLTSNPDPATVCFNDFITFTAGGGTQFQFLVNGAEAQALGAGNTFTSNTLPNNAQVTVRVIDANGCEDVSSAIPVTVYATPNITMSANPSTGVCAGTPITFQGQGGVQYEFKLNGAVIQALSNDDTYVLAAPSDGDVVAVVGVDGNGCTAESADYTVTVFPDPVAGLSVAPSSSVCAGELLTFTATGGSEYLFYVNAVAQGVWSATSTFQSSTLNNGDVVYARVRTLNGCEANSAPITVTINKATATLSSNPSPANICFNDFITFTAGGGVQYEFLVNGSVAQALGASNTFTSNTIPNGALVSVRVVDANGCEDVSSAIPVTVYATPNITMSANPSTGVCAGTPITFQGQGGVQYEFKLNGAVIQALSNDDTYVLAAPSDGDVVAVVGVDGNGCTAESADYTVTVFPDPVAGLSVAPSSSVCAGELLTFTATGGSEYLFYVNAVAQGVWSATSTFQSSTLNNGDVVYARVRTLNGCEANSAPITVTINKATATLSSNPSPANICFNDFITFTAGGGVQYEFLVNGSVAQVLGASNTFTSNTIPNGALVSVRAVDANGCEDVSSDIPVTVYATPNITMSANPSTGVCAGTPITFQGQGGVQYEFKLNGAVIQALSNDDTYVLAAPSDGDVVAVVGVDGNGCTAESADYTVTVFPDPVAGLSVAPSSSVCAGELLTFTATGGSEYLFYVNNIEQGVWSVNDTFQSSTLNNGDVVHVRVRNINGCEANSAPIAITINQIEANISITGPVPGLSTVCRNSNVTFSASPAGAVNYEFFATRGGIDVPLYQGNQNILSISNLQDNDEVFVRITDANNCVDNSDKIRVNIVELPVPVVNITPVPLCEGSPVTLTATPGFDKYELFVNGVQVGSSQTSNIFNPAGLNNGDQVVVVAYEVVSAALECYGSSSPKTINFLPLPNITLNSDQPLNTFCLGTNVTFTASNGVEYQFFVNGNMVQDFSPLATYSSNTLNHGDEVTVIGRGANGCYNTSAPVVVVVNEATAGLSSSDTDNIICVGQSITFTATGGVDYEFILDGTPQGPSANNEFVFTGLAAGNHSLFVRVQDANGCFDDSDDVINIQVLPLPVAVLDVDNSNPVCQGTELTFTGQGGVNYTFYVNDVVVQPLSTNNVFTTTSLNDGDVVHVVVANNNDCESVSNKIAVQIWELPVIALSANKLLGCENELLNFTATSPSAGMQYEFIIDGNNIVQALSPLNTLDHGAVADFTVQVRGVDANGCEALSNILNITVSQVNPTLDATSNITCFGNPVRLTATGGVNYEFFQNGNSVQDGASNVFDYLSFDSGNQVFTVLVTNADGCSKLSGEVPVFVNDLPVITFAADDADNTVCAGESVTFTATGGDTYEFFVNNVSVQGPAAEGTCTYAFTGDGVYNVYVEVTNTTTSCAIGSADIVITANPVPVATLTAAPSTNIIEGTEVTFAAGEPGREYEFYVNGTKVQDRAPNNTFVTSALQDGDEVIVYVYNEFGCFSTASLTISVLDGISILPVVPETGNYCEGSEGITVTLPNPQGGITYRLVHPATNTTVGAPIEFNGGGDVSWSDVKVQPGYNPSVYVVEAFYALLPAEVYQMANTVTITEDLLPVVFKLSPYNAEFTGCAAVEDLKLEGSELNVRYSLLLNGISLGVTIDGTGNELNFGKQFIVGQYTIEARNSNSGCARLMDGYYQINGETVQSFNLTSDPANGNYCETADGVLIGLDGSEANVRYRLYRNGADTGEFVDGTGAAVTFARQTVDGVYSILIESATGCLYPMNGSVTVTKYAAPVAYDLSVTNNGHYCEGDAGVEISVSGQQEGYVYTLLFNGNPVDPAVTHVGLPGAETIAFTFAGTYAAEGVYTVQATIPDVDCPQLMNGSVTVVADALPNDYNLLIDHSTICVGDATAISILGSEADVSYSLIHSPTSSVVETQTGNGGRLVFNNIALAGEYYVEAVRLGNPTACSRELISTVTLTLVDRPLYLMADVWLEEVASDPADPCGFVNIFVHQAQFGFTYQLYKKFTTGLVPVGGQSFVATANADENVFGNITDNNGEYYVMVSNGSCEEQLEDFALVSVPGAVAVYEVIGDDEICNGDPGVRIRLSGSEVGVEYTLIEVRDSKVWETVSGDGNELSFSTLLRNPGRYKIVGVNGVSGCTAEMTPYFDLKVNPLPISYPLVGSGNYCTGEVGAEIKLKDSELDVNYILQRVEGADQMEIKVVQGTGDEISFGHFDAGTYRVVAYNDLTLCTSSMEGEVTITENPVINTSLVIDAETSFCANSLGALVTIHTPQEQVQYEIRNEANVLVTQFVGTADATQFNYYLTSAGTYTIWASYGGDGCLVQLTEFAVERLDAPTVKFVVSSDVADGCGSSGATITLSGSENGFVYELNVFDGVTLLSSERINGTGEALSWFVTHNGSGTIRYEVIASNEGNCELLMGSVVLTFKPAPAVLDLDATPRPYCHDDLGLQIDLPVDAEVGIYYRLFTGDDRSVFLKGIEASATNTSFDGKYPAGIYYIQAVNITTGCYVWMNNHIEIVENPNPDVSIRLFYALEDREDDNFGMVGAGNLKLDISSVDVNYTLWVVRMDGTVEQVQTLEGNGSELVFDPTTVGGHYFVQATDRVTGCTSEISHRLLVTENPLKAFDGFMNLKTTSVSSSMDIINADPAMIQYSIGVDKIYSLDAITEELANVEFELITEFTYATPSGETALFNTIGDVKLNSVTGLLEYTKKVGFFGSDSLRYRIRNKDIPGREDTGTIFIFAGNNDADEDNPFLIPNAFSPNEDGINDRFVVSLPKFIKEDGYQSKLEVFNRWGTLVYQSKGARYDNSWDGKSTEAAMVSIGDDLPSGTYFYVFKITFIEGEKHVSKELSGYIELRR